MRASGVPVCAEQVFSAQASGVQVCAGQVCAEEAEVKVCDAAEAAGAPVCGDDDDVSHNRL